MSDTYEIENDGANYSSHGAIAELIVKNCEVLQLKRELKKACLHAKWLSDRLIHQYGENANYDYHIKSQAMGDKWKS